MTKAVRTIAVGAAISLSAAQAHALNTRTWISGKETDAAGCGPIATPCRTLQFAHDQTSSGGEIDVLDSAGYGSVIITKGISVVGDGVIAGILAGAGANAITINAGASDKILLRGLTIEGAGVGLNGIIFNSGGGVDVANSVVQNFMSYGILAQPTSGSPAIVVTNTDISHNGATGFQYLPPSGNPTASIIIDRVKAVDNSYGVIINGFYITSATLATVSNSIVSKNATNGIRIIGNQTKANVDLCNADNNAGTGYYLFSGFLTIGRSVAANNGGYGLYNNTGTLSSFRDNRFAGNSGGITGGVISTGSLN